MKLVDGKAKIDQDTCLGYGRCERACPYKAISITLDNPCSIDKLIKLLPELNHMRYHIILI